MLKEKAEKEINEKLKVAQQAIHKKSITLAEQRLFFETEKKIFESYKNLNFSELKKKEEKVCQFYQEALAAAEEAKKIRHEANKKLHSWSNGLAKFNMNSIVQGNVQKS